MTGKAREKESKWGYDLSTGITPQQQTKPWLLHNGWTSCSCVSGQRW